MADLLVSKEKPLNDTVALKKIAFFVEGMTEMIFLQKLLSEIVTKNHYSLQVRKMRGGNKSISNIEVITEIESTPDTKCFILITECGGDSTVKSYILEEREKLIKNGYALLVGIVDLYPKLKTDLASWIKGLLYRVPQVPIPTEFIIPTMEIESWFIAEHSHFIKINPLLTKENILSKEAINFDTLIVEDIAHPSNQLNSIYAIEGERYIKKRGSIQRTVDVLDYSEIYFELPKRIDSLKQLIEIINTHVLI